MRKDLGKIASFWNKPTECWKCGKHSDLEAAHIIPKCIGGSNKTENLVILCKRCHEFAPNVNDKEYMWEWINYEGMYIADFLDNMTSSKHKKIIKILKILKSKKFQEWDDANTGTHGLKVLPFDRIVTTYNWKIKKCSEMICEQ